MLPKVKQPVCIDCPFQGYCFTEETSKGSLRWQVAIPDLLEPAVGSSCTAERQAHLGQRGHLCLAALCSCVTHACPVTRS